MRKTKTFKVEGHDKSFEVRELKVKEIIGLIQEDSLGGDTSVDGLKQVLADRLLPLCSNVTLDEFLEMTPGEIQEVWGHFYEVNGAFFVLARKAGLSKLMEELQRAIIADFGKLLVSSSSQGTPTS